MPGALLIFLTFSLFIFTTHFASEYLLIPGPEAEITKCLSRRGRFSGTPRKADFGILTIFGGPPDFGGSGWRGDFLPISYIYREGYLGVHQ